MTLKRLHASPEEQANGASPERDSRLPVTVLSGFLGSGKTTTLTHVLSNNAGLKIALIVNDMASVNVDSLAIDKVTKEQMLRSSKIKLQAESSSPEKNEGVDQRAQHLQQVEQIDKPKMVSLQNGCICCTLREDLVEQVSELAADNKYDYLIIESTGISEPVPVAQTFCHSLKELEQMASGENQEEQPSEQPSSTLSNNSEAELHNKKVAVQAIQLQKVARLDTMVTVVDAAEIWEVLGSVETLRDSKWSQKEAATSTTDDSIDLDRSIVDLLVDQIEFANVILLNKKDLLLGGRDGGSKSSTSTTTAVSTNSTAISTTPENKPMSDNPSGPTNRDSSTSFSTSSPPSRSSDGAEDPAASSPTETAVAPTSSGTATSATTEASVSSASNTATSTSSPSQLSKVRLIENLIKKLNPQAQVHWTEYGKIAPELILGTNLFDFERASTMAGWQAELANNGHHIPETEEYGISSVVFRAKRPFVPSRLQKILDGFGRVSDHVAEVMIADKNKVADHKNKVVVVESESSPTTASSSSNTPQPEAPVVVPVSKKMTEEEKEKMLFKGVIRSKGHIWLANCSAYRMEWHSVGRQFALRQGLPFDAAIREAGYDPDDPFGEEAASKEKEATTSSMTEKEDKKSEVNKDKVEEKEVEVDGKEKKKLKTSSASEGVPNGSSSTCTSTEKARGVSSPSSSDPASSASSSTTTKTNDLSASSSTTCSTTNSTIHDPVWGDRETELVIIGIGLEKEKITKALTAALVSEKEMKAAAKEKQRFETYINKVKEDQRTGKLKKPPSGRQLLKGTGGLQSPWDRFHRYKDVFFGGKAHREYMEFEQ